MGSLRICFVSFEYPPSSVGGCGVYAQKIATALSELGHEVCVVSSSIGQKIATEKVGKLKIVRIPVINLPSLRFLSFELKRLFISLDRSDFDIIHFNGACQLNTNSSKPSVVTVHHSPKALKAYGLAEGNLKVFVTGELNPFNSIMEKRTLRKVFKIISVSKATKFSIIDQYGIPEEKIDVIYHGIDAEDYVFSSEEIKSTRKSFGITDEDKLLLSTPGRIDDPRKGIRYLLLALREVFSDNNNVKCIITGSGDSEYFREYLDRIPKGKLNFVGFTSDILKRRLIAACDIFILPSLFEGFSLSILEAMAAGKPVISTNSGAIPELITSGKNGILVEPRNWRKLKVAIEELLSHETESKKFGINNYYKSRTFSWKQSARLTEKIYYNLLN